MLPQQCNSRSKEHISNTQKHGSSKEMCTLRRTERAKRTGKATTNSKTSQRNKRCKRRHNRRRVLSDRLLGRLDHPCQWEWYLSQKSTRDAKEELESNHGLEKGCSLDDDNTRATVMRRQEWQSERQESYDLRRTSCCYEKTFQLASQQQLTTDDEQGSR